jgi:hypothetical protein
MVLLLVSSVVLGIIMGAIFFTLFKHTVPPAMLTDFNRGTAHVAFIVYGAIAGVVICVWSLAAIVLSRLFAGAKKSPATGARSVDG